MAAHARVGAHGALEVDARGGGQRAEVGQAQGLGRDADGELGGRGGGEGYDGEADAVDGDGVAEVGVGEEGGGGREGDGEGGAAGGVGGVELGDDWEELGICWGIGGRNVPPISSTIPVNMFAVVFGGPRSVSPIHVRGICEGSE